MVSLSYRIYQFVIVKPIAVPEISHWHYSGMGGLWWRQMLVGFLHMVGGMLDHRMLGEGRIVHRLALGIRTMLDYWMLDM